MKFSEVRGMSTDDKRRKMKELKEELFQTKMKNTLGQVGNTMSIRALRRDIARLMTALNEK
jgi:large subunit ribosomal protein L29